MSAAPDVVPFRERRPGHTAIEPEAGIKRGHVSSIASLFSQRLNSTEELKKIPVVTRKASSRRRQQPQQNPSSLGYTPVGKPARIQILQRTPESEDGPISRSNVRDVNAAAPGRQQQQERPKNAWKSDTNLRKHGEPPDATSRPQFVTKKTKYTSKSAVRDEADNKEAENGVIKDGNTPGVFKMEEWTVYETVPLSESANSVKDKERENERRRKEAQRRQAEEQELREKRAKEEERRRAEEAEKRKAEYERRLRQEQEEREEERRRQEEEENRRKEEYERQRLREQEELERQRKEEEEARWRERERRKEKEAQELEAKRRKEQEEEELRHWREKEEAERRRRREEEEHRKRQAERQRAEEEERRRRERERRIAEEEERKKRDEERRRAEDQERRKREAQRRQREAERRRAEEEEAGQDRRTPEMFKREEWTEYHSAPVPAFDSDPDLGHSAESVVGYKRFLQEEQTPAIRASHNEPVRNSPSGHQDERRRQAEERRRKDEEVRRIQEEEKRRLEEEGIERRRREEEKKRIGSERRRREEEERRRHAEAEERRRNEAERRRHEEAERRRNEAERRRRDEDRRRREEERRRREIEEEQTDPYASKDSVVGYRRLLEKEDEQVVARRSQQAQAAPVRRQQEGRRDGASRETNKTPEVYSREEWTVYETIPAYMLATEEQSETSRLQRSSSQESGIGYRRLLQDEAERPREETRSRSQTRKTKYRRGFESESAGREPVESSETVRSSRYSKAESRPMPTRLSAKELPPESAEDVRMEEWTEYHSVPSEDKQRQPAGRRDYDFGHEFQERKDDEGVETRMSTPFKVEEWTEVKKVPISLDDRPASPVGREWQGESYRAPSDDEGDDNPWSFSPNERMGSPQMLDDEQQLTVDEIVAKRRDSHRRRREKEVAAALRQLESPTPPVDDAPESSGNFDPHNGRSGEEELRGRQATEAEQLQRRHRRQPATRVSPYQSYQRVPQEMESGNVFHSSFSVSRENPVYGVR